jgi:hypothetical protein
MKTLLTLGLGALAMYLLDPDQGRRRRAQLRGQWDAQLRGQREQGRKKMLQPEKPVETPPSAHHLGR